MTAAGLPDLDLEAQGFAVLRTPLLPFDELVRWADGLESPALTEAGSDRPDLAAALERDRAELRRRLDRVLDRPEVREALFVASPSLSTGLAHWRREPDGKKGKRAEDALVRYLVRMASRATPFGLFSGCSPVATGDGSRLRLAARAGYRRCSRLDHGFLSTLGAALERDRELRRRLTYHPNSSLYRSAGRLRYSESRMDGSQRTYNLVAVDPDPFVELALDEARRGITVDDLARALAAADPEGEVEVAEAEEFVHELIDAQLLVSDLEPLVTGGEALDDLLAHLAEAGAPDDVGRRLAAARDALAELDRGGVGADPAAYRAIGDTLGGLPVEVSLPRLFQVDMMKPAPESAVGTEVLSEIRRGLALLRRLAGRTPEDEMLDRWAASFVERYGADREVPLLEVLDEESGIGFERRAGGEVAPLLDGLELPAAEAPATVGWGTARQRVLRLLGDALDRGDRQLEIGEADLADVGGDETPLCDALEVMASVAAGSPEALADGDFQVLVKGVFGPSAGRLLTRFCHASPQLEEHVRRVVEAEEALDPDVLFAEVVHLPQGRVGNILARPVLRRAEIPYLGRSGAAAEDRLPLQEITVSVRGGDIVLSTPDGRRVEPRLTTAHNYANRALGVYRFLGALQARGRRSALRWDWGPLQALPFLPRVTSGRVVLSRARWMLSADDVAALTGGDEAERYAAVAAWRRRRDVPRWVVLPEGDNELVVDLDNPLSLDAFTDRIGGRPHAPVLELFPAPDELCAEGPEGRFTHELLVPLVRNRQPTRRPRRRISPVTVRRSFAPGSEWLYVRLYTGTGSADRVLSHVVSRVVHPALADGAADRWFFLRYGDPDWHLRLRLHGDPRRLAGEVLGRLEDALAPLLAEGQVWKLELGTYEREVERYGGATGIDLAERLFHADSEAVATILDSLGEGPARGDKAWRLALVGVDRLLDDLGLEGAAKLSVLESLHTAFAAEHRADARLKKQMSTRLRGERKALDRLLDAAAGDRPLASDDSIFEPALAALARRSAASSPLAAELREAEAEGRLEVSLAGLATSLTHMHVNRMLRSQARAQEMVIYDFLHRLFLSRRLRRRALAEQVS